jgi:hypothetical protein
MKNAIPLLAFMLVLTCGCQAQTAVLPSAINQDTAEKTGTAVKTDQPGNLEGQVVDESGPVAGAVVRQKATGNYTLTDSNGTFTLQDLPYDQALTITAWADGYFVGWAEIPPGEFSPITITIKPYYTYDNHEYNWFSTEGEDGSASCAHCMPCYSEWQADAHSRSAVNPRFLSMYNGSDLSGNTSPKTRFTNSSDYGFIPLPPDPNQPYYGPGYKLDFPETAGNCAACHVPAQAAHPGMAYGADPNLADGIELEGVFCEFCHKIGAVALDPDTQLPYPYMPGVLSIQLHRPAGEDQLFFGNFDDVTRRVSKLPLESESAFCAPCHHGVFWDVLIYNSYGEWLDSPYSDPDTGQTCQNCHMAPVDYDYFTYPEQGGEIRNRSGIFSHYMPGAADPEFLAEAAQLEVEAEVRDGQLVIEATVINHNTGHKLPTDSPLRQVLLVVEAVNEQGDSLPLLEGPQIPTWGGKGGNPENGYYAGVPGRGYALILRELWTGISPTGAYWNPVVVDADTRLDPFQKDHSRYIFQLMDEGRVQVRVRLIFRRAFKSLMVQKGWNDPDILMQEIQLTLPD